LVPDVDSRDLTRKILNVVKPGVLFILLFTFTSCVAPDRDHRILVSVPDQRMMVFGKGRPVAEYPISTSRFGLGDIPGSFATPLGHLKIKKKFGARAPSGSVFRDRKATGEILLPNTPGRDPIVTRILWLEGLDPENRLAYERFIYIHGTPVEEKLGSAASYGCIRMGSHDIMDLFDLVGIGARVDILDEPLSPPAPRPDGSGS
jgi:hypothetical protein